MLNVASRCEDRLSQLEFSQNAPQAPHIDGKRVASSEDDFGSSIISGLQVRINLVPLEAASAEVYDFDTGLGPFAECDVFGFQVTVNYIFLLEEIEGVEELDSENPDLIVVHPMVVVGNDQVEKVSF